MQSGMSLPMKRLIQCLIHYKWNNKLQLIGFKPIKKHILEKANCFLVKAADKSEPNAVRRSAAYQTLSRISQIYRLEGALKDLSPE